MDGPSSTNCSRLMERCVEKWLMMIQRFECQPMLEMSAITFLTAYSITLLNFHAVDDRRSFERIRTLSYQHYDSYESYRLTSELYELIQVVSIGHSCSLVRFMQYHTFVFVRDHNNIKVDIVVMFFWVQINRVFFWCHNWQWHENRSITSHICCSI